jgi:hypothetical protein
MEDQMSLTLSKPQGVGLALSNEEVIELKMLVQDEDEAGALDYLQRLKRRVVQLEQKHCGDPDRLPGT